MIPTKEQAKRAIEAFLGVCEAVDEVIAAHGPQGVPSGHLYARVCGKMSLEMYQKVIDTLTGAGLVKHKGHLLISTKGGPSNDAEGSKETVEEVPAQDSPV